MRNLKFLLRGDAAPNMTRGEIEEMDRDIELMLSGIPEYRAIVEAAITAAKIARDKAPADHNLMLGARIADIEREFRKLYQ